MQKNTYPGKFIVFEGIDGSGKSIQLKLLLNRLKKEGYNTAFFDFPQYGKKSAGLAEEYLSGAYGSAREVGPFRSSIFYACDRYDASFQLKKYLKEGRIVVSDRYVGSNMAHQGGKIKSQKEREKFFAWLHELEYEIFGIPKPTKSFFLHVPLEIAGKLRENPERRKKKKKDIHETDFEHLKNAQHAYLHAMKVFPKDFTAIECAPKGILLAPKIIHEKIWKEVKKLL
ncbi:MAG: thymidylate kinase Tmk [Parcubacteria group bacterium Greene0714_21]|nr:MAG: thymidylate kinase Tmk [Parcubacteria group bacterium Greene0416_39]TSC98557.1 MAG: thymidylate kinase Tmk [Parcubacteria group bacterium Greene1014_47]TSD04318.1 MAG: thymidylate kinase Tmk [Parcubacteria group bacterium Greene0714_21]